jgi:hypothetical protein
MRVLAWFGLLYLLFCQIGTSISGNALGLRIAAGNVPNLVDPVTGTWGKVLLDPINSTQTATLATLDTVGSLLTASFTVADDNWRTSFFKAATPTGGATPKNTLEVVAGIAREPWAAPKELFALFDQATTQRSRGASRAVPAVSRGSTARFCPQPLLRGRWHVCERKVHVRQGWQFVERAKLDAGVLRNIGGGVIKMAPNGNGAILEGVGVNAIIASVQQEDSGEAEPACAWSAHT